MKDVGNPSGFHKPVVRKYSAVRFRPRPPLFINTMNIQRIRAYFDADFLTEAFLLFIKENTKKVVITLITIFVCIFAIIFLSNKHQEKIDGLVSQYIIAQSKIAQKENADALKTFQHVYNNSKGTLEAMALINIIDILLQDKQPQAIKTLLEEIPTLKQKPEIFILLYSKALNTIDTLKKQKNIASVEEQKLFNTFAAHLENIKMPKEFLPHKYALLFAFGKPLPQNLANLPQNEITKTLEIIQENIK